MTDLSDIGKVAKVTPSTKALVLGNGPSLDSIDFDLLKRSDVIVFATNRIADLCRKNDWHPDFYAAFFCAPFRGRPAKWREETLHWPTLPEFPNEGDEAREDIKYVCDNKTTTCFVHQWYSVFLESAPNINFMNPVLWNRFEEFPIDGFESFQAPEKFLWHTATTPLFQLCFMMNIKNIGILGQDGHPEGSSAHSHFEGYRGPERPGVAIPRRNKKIVRLHDAVDYYAKQNEIQVVNLSSRSVVEHYEVVKFSDYVT